MSDANLTTKSFKPRQNYFGVMGNGTKYFLLFSLVQALEKIRIHLPSSINCLRKIVAQFANS